MLRVRCTGGSLAHLCLRVVRVMSIRKVVFYAVREIRNGEELCYDYGEGFKRDCGIKLV